MIAYTDACPRSSCVHSMRETRGVPRIFKRGARPKAEIGSVWVSWGGDSNPLSTIWESGERCERSQRDSGQTPRPHKGFPLFSFFNTQDGLSGHYNIVNCGQSCSHWGARPPCPPPHLPAYAAERLCNVNLWKYVYTDDRLLRVFW